MVTAGLQKELSSNSTKRFQKIHAIQLVGNRTQSLAAVHPLYPENFAQP
jgi:hypothetical protein